MSSSSGSSHVILLGMPSESLSKIGTRVGLGGLLLDESAPREERGIEEA